MRVGNFEGRIAPSVGVANKCLHVVQTSGV